VSTVNRPGLPALNYRVGTHATFLEAMKGRLASLYIEIRENELDEKGQQKIVKLRPLRDLRTRLADDAVIAFWDAWALVADVLTFYQERIANEGYLRTATERRSILELARLVGYSLRPGVASTVYLAYTIDQDRTVDPPKEMQTGIPAGARAQSVPGPGELPQSFETAESLDANSAWNNLQVRLTRPQTKDSIDKIDKDKNACVYLKGTATNLNPNDPLLIMEGTGKPNPEKDLYRVIDVVPDAAKGWTAVELQPWIKASANTEKNTQQEEKESTVTLDELLEKLSRAPSVPPANSAQLRRDVATAFDAKADTKLQLVSSLRPEVKETLHTALSNAKMTDDSTLKVYAFRVKAAPFGSNAPKRMRVHQNGEVEVVGEWPVIANLDGLIIKTTTPDTIYLNGSFDKILGSEAQRPSWIVIETRPWKEKDEKDPPHRAITTPAKTSLLTSIIGVNSGLHRSEYGITGPATEVKLESEWLKIPEKSNDFPQRQEVFDLDFQVIRNTTVYAQSEELELADEPIEDDVRNGKTKRIELARLYSGLKPGRWLIVSGERTDITSNGVVVPGVYASELVMLADVTYDANPDLPGDTTHTFITLADNDLAYRYKRDTVQIGGNVVKATHGETRNEVLGSGDGSKALQQFTLRQPPLTYVPASNPSGVDSTLQLRVNDVLWHETDSLADLLPTDRKFITRTDDDGKTTIIFGNGQQGARLPTGQENVKAVYRNGIGKSGNVKADQITLLATRPLGVKGVTNPIRASSGADRESRNQARKNAPLGVMALDRLVSVDDYADFARTFGGIGKASSVHLSDGQRQLVHVTIAGADDIPILESSDLYRNLVQALHDFGDPHLPIQVATRKLLALVVSANVRVLPDYQWESVKPNIITTMLEEFGFQRRELGQPVFLSEVISAIQRVQGVAYVDVDVLDTVSEAELSDSNALPAKFTDTPKPKQSIPVRLAGMDENVMYPAQLAFLVPDVPATLILNEVTG
jgi:predicted phage baseplate assembly protein